MARTPVPSGRSQGRSVLDAPMMKKRVLNHEVSDPDLSSVNDDYSRAFPCFRLEARRKPNGSAVCCSAGRSAGPN